MKIKNTILFSCLAAMFVFGMTQTVVAAGSTGKQDAADQSEVSQQEDAPKKPCSKKKKKGPRLTFTELDINKDGMLEKEEFIAAHRQKLETKFSKLDLDENGTVPEDEFNEACAEKDHKVMGEKPHKPCKKKGKHKCDEDCREDK